MALYFLEMLTCMVEILFNCNDYLELSFLFKGFHIILLTESQIKCSYSSVFQWLLLIALSSLKVGSITFFVYFHCHLCVV